MKTTQSQNNQDKKQIMQKLKQQLCQDIEHPRIKELICAYENPYNSLLENTGTSKQELQAAFQTNIQLLEQRKWLTKKGKKYLIDFDDDQRKQMKYCFNALDYRQQGSIGIDELEQLLLSVGLMQTRQQVKILIDSVDEDMSGKIQFSQFLKMILNDQGQNQEIVSFFKFIINNNRKKKRQLNVNMQMANNKKPYLPNTKNASNNTNSMKNNYTSQSNGTNKQSIFDQRNTVVTKKNQPAMRKKISLLTATQKENIYESSFSCKRSGNKIGNLGNLNSPLSQKIQRTQTDRYNQRETKERNKKYTYLQKYRKGKLNGRQNNTILSILDRHPHPKNLPFGMVVSHIRRKHMMTALKIGGSSSLSRKQSTLSSDNSAFNIKSSQMSNAKQQQRKNQLFQKSSMNLKSMQCFYETTTKKRYKNNAMEKQYQQQNVKKGQEVMNALKKMWDRRLLRQIKQVKMQSQNNENNQTVKSQHTNTNLTKDNPTKQKKLPNLL